MMGAAHEQNQLLRDIQTHITKLEEGILELSKSGLRAVHLQEIKEKVLSMRKKIEDRDHTIENLKESFEVLKRENTELRAFKQQHENLTNEENHKLKKSKPPSLWSRIVGTRK